jgi:transcriptional regulator with XRE-family HTH domain
MFDNRLKQIDLAKQLGVSETFVSQIVNEKANISIDKVDEYCKLLGIKVELKEKE